eukprot:gene31067-38968_t
MNADSIIRHSAASDNDDEDEGPVHQVTLLKTLQQRIGKGKKMVFTPESLTEYHRIVDEFELSGPRISRLFHRVLGFFTGLPLGEVEDMAPLPKKSAFYQHVRMMGHVKRLEMSQERDADRPFFATEADEGSKGRSKLMIAFAVFKKASDVAGRRLLAGATRISNTTAEVSLRGILKGFHDIQWPTLYLLWITGDSCSSMKAIVPLAADEKRLEFAEALARDDMGYPDFLPIDVTMFFLVHVDRPRQLIPLHGGHYIDDANHMPKNGEAAMFKEMGSGVNLASGKLVLGFLKGELFRWSRLHKGSHEFRDLVRFLEPDIQKLYKTIPAEINHRLTIATRLAMLYNDFRVPLMSVCEKFNYAYGGDKWRGDRQATLDHMKEVYASLSDIRVQSWSLLLRRLHDFSVEVYTITQYNSGINVVILRAQSEDILANLEAFDINFDTVFKEEKVAIERWAQEAEQSGQLALIAEKTVEALKTGKSAQEVIQEEGSNANECHLLQDVFGEDIWGEEEDPPPSGETHDDGISEVEDATDDEGERDIPGDPRAQEPECAESAAGSIAAPPAQDVGSVTPVQSATAAAVAQEPGSAAPVQ